MSGITQERLPVFIKTGWAIGELSVATYVGITMMYMLFFLTEALEVPPVWAGLALLIPRLWDVITDPIMGAISDRTRSRFGRRRPYLLAGGLLLGTSFSLLFMVPDFDSVLATTVYVTAMYLVVSSAYTIYDVPYSSMAAEMTNNYRERTLLVGYKMIAARVGIVVSVLAGPYLFRSGDTLREGFELLGMVLGGFMVVTALTAFFTTRNAPQIARPIERFSLRDELMAVIRNRPFAILFGVFMFQNLAIGASATALIYYLITVMRTDVILAGQLFSVLAISATIFTPMWVYIGRRFGKTETYKVSLLIAALITLPALFLPAAFYFFLFGILFLSGIADASNQLMPNSMVPDTVEVDELQTGQRREGAIFGAWAFCRKLGMAAGAFFVSIGLDLFRYIPGEANVGAQPDSAVLGIRVLYALVPFLLWLAAAGLLRKYDLSEARYGEVMDAIGRGEKQRKHEGSKASMQPAAVSGSSEA
jgi:sugar (glycoside-pentoside-hexuronide) transporter